MAVKTKIGLALCCTISLLCGCGNNRGLTQVSALGTEGVIVGWTGSQQVFSAINGTLNVQSGDAIRLGKNRPLLAGVAYTDKKSYIKVTTYGGKTADDDELIEVEQRIKKIHFVLGQLATSQIKHELTMASLTESERKTEEEKIEKEANTEIDRYITTKNSDEKIKIEVNNNNSPAFLFKLLVYLQDDLNKNLKANNIKIYRWNQAKSSSNSFSISELLSLNSSNNIGNSGYAILSGIRSCRLYLGRDYITVLSKMDPMNGLSKSNTTGLVTSTVQAKKIRLFAQRDMKSTVEAVFDVDLSQFVKTDKFDPAAFKNAIYKAKVHVSSKLENIDTITQISRLGDGLDTTIEPSWGSNNPLNTTKGLEMEKTIDGWTTVEGTITHFSYLKDTILSE